MTSGTVYLVGAGPGDVGLLTMRAAELLGRADVVVYDALVNPELLRLAPKGAEIIYGGKRSRDHAIPQDQLNKLLVEKARTGKSVVRLKGGDPYVFGRGGEEAQELAEAGIRFEVVPGISSVVAAPNYAGIPLTHRDHCATFTVFTGHEDPTKESSNLDLAWLAKTPGTKVILMGVERIRPLTSELVAQGMSKETPVGMIRWGTRSKQETLFGTLGTIADLVEKTGFSAPAVTIIGGVVTLHDQLDWFQTRPLFGQRVVVTRTRDQASEVSRRLRDLGADVLEIPTIRITHPDEPKDLVDAILELNSYEWLVFTSPNGVTAFFEIFFKSFDDLRDIGGCRIAAVGPATAARLKELHLRVDLMPDEYVSSKIAAAFKAEQSIENVNILLLRAQVANPELPQALMALGAIVDDVACYKTVPETEDVTGSAARMLEEGADLITFTSASTVENFHARFNLPELLKKFPETRLASIGPETTKAIKALGLEAAVEAKPHNIDGLIAAVQKGSKPRRRGGK
ncbi:MAG TPA: uroporphyrinogen-III C-methyltransferase [Verrucomicrobiales bacterium]|nr:uroporphyrinogen-III C-methyltransferase [Verrucomicrobiales bacterium]